MQNAASENSEEEESRLGTWLDLMGSDLRLKVGYFYNCIKSFCFTKKLTHI